MDGKLGCCLLKRLQSFIFLAPVSQTKKNKPKPSITKAQHQHIHPKPRRKPIHGGSTAAPCCRRALDEHTDAVPRYY